MENKKNDSALVRSSAAEYLTFVASTGEDKDSIEMRYEDENIWLTQKMMAALYDVSVAAINQHLKKIFEDGELQEEAVIKKYLITATDGKKYNTNHYNLQAIIAVGFKVNNQRAVRFRVWANQIVEQYTIKGWAMDEERLKNGGTVLTKKYFEEQLERIREIRISERNFYQKLTDIYATALDYDRNALTTKAKEDITDDVVFEVELIRQIEINIDYILMLVKKYHDTHCNDKEVLITIRKAIDASPELRSKKQLIETFIADVNDVDDVVTEWNAYVSEQREKELTQIIQEEKLKEPETRKYLANAFRDGEIKTVGTDIDKLMPPVSRFGGGGRTQKKQTVIDKLKEFFDKYFGVGGSSMSEENS